jgi:RNA polymerase sigma-70 factor (ECF subfamily)
MELAGQHPLPANPVAWLYRVVRNRAISLARSAQRRQRHEALASQLRPRFEAGELPGIEAADLAAALQSLDADQREAVIARTWSGMAFEQIADLAGCSVSTAHRRYEAGLAALRERLEIRCPKDTICPLPTSPR